MACLKEARQDYLYSSIVYNFKSAIIPRIAMSFFIARSKPISHFFARLTVKKSTTTTLEKERAVKFVAGRSRLNSALNSRCPDQTMQIEKKTICRKEDMHSTQSISLLGTSKPHRLRRKSPN